MAERRDRVVIRVERRLPEGWIVIRSTVEPDFALHFVLNTGSPMSVISAATRTELDRYGYIDQIDGNRCRIPEWNIDGQRIAPLSLRVSSVMTRLHVSGFLGLQFLGQFKTIHFDRDTDLLTLTYPEDEP